ncbi:hypothetical protein [Nonomuraea sp. 10N515B]|uniref:hypothetical protein n=1 Tax=Nonomuraea sp. 10N515B TaxID=3457422 RepID=UPI003FCE3F03
MWGAVGSAAVRDHQATLRVVRIEQGRLGLTAGEHVCWIVQGYVDRLSGWSRASS